MTDVQMHDALTPLLVDADLVSEHPDNPRQGRVEDIAASIAANGLYKPLVVQKSTGHILSGNHTYRALTEAGAELVPVIYVDVNDDQAKRILLADNRTSELGTFDEVMLAELLTEMSEGGDLLGTGYTEEDLADLMVSMEPEPVKPQHTDSGKEAADYNADGLDITVGFADERKVASRRMMVMDLPVNRYLWLIDNLTALAEQMNLLTNSDVVLRLVSERVGSPVPAGVVDAPTAEELAG